MGVKNSRPVSWTAARWQKWWSQPPPLPHSATLDALATEVQTHGCIRRRFVYDLARKNLTDIFIAAMAWGLGDDGRRAQANLRKALTANHQNQPAAVLTNAEQAMRDPVRAIAEAFWVMFPGGGKSGIPSCGVAFATKALHFLGYETTVRPRPLIYDENVARALARMPQAPYVTHPGDSGHVRGKQYQRCCEWAEAFAEQRGAEPIVVEYALFEVGRQLG